MVENTVSSGKHAAALAFNSDSIARQMRQIIEDKNVIALAGGPISQGQISLLREGPTNRKYKLESAEGNFVLRFSMVDGIGMKASILNREYKALMAASHLGVTPQPYHMFDGNGSIEPFTMIEYVDGDPIEGATISDITQIARAVAKLHSASIKLYGPESIEISDHKDRTSWLSRRIKEFVQIHTADLGGQSARSILECVSIVDGIPAPTSSRVALTHGDVCYCNIIKGDGIRLIDLERASAREPEFDMAILFCNRSMTEDLKEAAIGEYNLSSSYILRPQEIERTQIPIELNRIVWSIEQVLSGAESPELAKALLIKELSSQHQYISDLGSAAKAITRLKYQLIENLNILRN